MANERRFFESITEITPEDVKWLKSGCYRKGYYIYNDHNLYYKTKRGVTKTITCFVHDNGNVKWRGYSLKGNPTDKLTNEEMAVFEPEKYAKRVAAKVERKAAEKAKAAKAAAECPVKVGDIFVGSFGYEACIYDYFEVVAVSKTGKSVTVRKLAEERNGTSWCEWESRAIPGRYVGEPMRKNLNLTGRTPYFKVSSYEWAYRTDNPEEWNHGYNYH